ncbi:hypothetical protein DESUT3_21970 [Desulfuromonas versatilis]|uniref:Response regulatory domain-containing protein n=1 Tax=Desulfuromonas versatilis TaxID=2802975 RepID=A0ABM8HX75_9BACT|nr:response regulator [Desulfuromonas versatilis]BCR05128.1 hypothetical protein DESUT3_21970 [Desulfuromonas versatilis]
MSLVGNLEDLGLGDILQIVSLSRKSGVLLLRSNGREGKIIFLNGQVIRASSSVSRENLGDLLLREGLVDLELLKKALSLQRNSHPAPRIGTILAENFGVLREAIDAIVRKKIETTVYSFFGWNEGSFSFELGEPADLADACLNPLQFMLEQGLNPQWLALEGSRVLDEARHRGVSLEMDATESGVELDSLLEAEALPRSGAQAAANAAADPVSPADGFRVLLIDDDPGVSLALVNALTAKGYWADSCGSAGEFLQLLGECPGGEKNTLLVIDLIMPRMDGEGLLGGLELLEQVRRSHPRVPVVMITDHPHREAQQRARALGVETILEKPKKPDLAGTGGQGSLEALATAIVKAAGGSGDAVAALSGGGSVSAVTINLGKELLRELGEVAPDEQRGASSVSTGLNLLRGMLQELNNPALGGGIILLVLRFASEFMNRAVIFLVKNGQIFGLGQFGLDGEGAEADTRVRRMQIPCGEDSIFQRVLQEKTPLLVGPGASQWDHYLQDQLEGGTPEEIFLGPIVSEGEVAAILYGDNLPKKKRIGETEALEIFLSQAGLAMDKALLERRLRGNGEL